ncbi:hypothetical protein VF21_04048 [Pseudogymnoascus sp. 05NY08]|nr:hypothetical protein VF21_04048 [Pseudogymnoascus sp. 05NY08]
MAKYLATLQSAPAIMLLALFSGVGFTIGHHFFYHSLVGQAVSSGYHVPGVNFTISGQQINIAVGSAFAFIVKALFGVAMSSAYNQIAWRTIKGRTSEIGAVDDLLAGTTNGLVIFKFSLWKRYPIPMLLAVIFWTLPIASIFPPATLTVQLTGLAKSTLQRVPRVDFLSLNFAKLPVPVGTSLAWVYRGPQYSVEQVVAGTLGGGQILPISAPSPNSSWAINFLGPALKCNPVESSLHKSIIQNIIEAVSARACQDSYGYLSWAPQLSSDGYTLDLTTNGSLPFTSNDNATYVLRPGALGPKLIDAPLSLYVATIPSMIPYDLSNSYSCDQVIPTLQSTAILKCDLYNASYVTNFTYLSGAQNVDIMINGSHGAVPYLPSVGGASPFGGQYDDAGAVPGTFNLTRIENFAYEAVMEAFGAVMEILWIAYGIAILVVLIGAIVGLTSRIMSGGSYSSKFSTFMRVTQGAHLSTSVREKDLDGKDPLPEYISKGTISWPTSEDLVYYMPGGKGEAQGGSAAQSSQLLRE